MIYAILAALLFGAAMPLSKSLLGTWHWLPLSGTFYLSSGVLLLAGRTVVRTGRPVGRKELPWLAAIVLLATVSAPVSLYGLALTHAHVGALLVNLETVFTAAIAVSLFRERLSALEWVAVALLVAGAAAVGATTQEAAKAPRPLLGAVLIAGACLCWGLDNNFTRRISQCDPLQITGIKGLTAGTAVIALALTFGKPPPPGLRPIVLASLVGLFSFGASIALFVVALRKLGAARTTAIFTSLAALTGVLLSWLLLGERPRWPALAGGAVMIAGILAMIRRGQPTA